MYEIGEIIGEFFKTLIVIIAIFFTIFVWNNHPNTQVSASYFCCVDYSSSTL